MKGRGIVRALLALALLVAAGPTLAVRVDSWKVSSTESFAAGTLEGTRIDAEGRLRLSREFRTLWGPSEGIVWAVVPDGTGGAFLGLSGPGRVVRVSAAGDTVETWYEDPDDGMVTALTADGTGGVFVGLSPGGRVVHLPEAGRSEDLLETGTEFIWSLLRGSDGTLWIATGSPGRLIALAPGAAEPATVLEADDDPVRCMTALPDGGIVAGTASRGRVVRVDGAGKLFVLLDAEEDEVVSVAAGADGTVWALVARAPGRAPAKPSETTPSAAGTPHIETVRVTASAPDDDSEEAKAPPSPKPAPGPARARPGGGLYRIDASGGIWRVWESATEVPYAVALDPEGFPIVATGDRGRILHLDRDGKLINFLRFPSNVVSALAPDSAGRLMLGGTGDARLAILGPGLSPEGRYVSEPFDAGSMAEWGRVRWDADLPRGASLRVQVRAGNSAEPDETWSPWDDIDEGGKVQGGRAAASTARWLQVRMEMTPTKTGQSPVLRSFEVHYQARNRPPRILSLTVEPPGVAWWRSQQQSNFGRGPLVTKDPVARRAAETLRPNRRGGSVIRKSYERGSRTFTWSAEDADGDPLLFALEVRAEGEIHWFPIARDIEDDFYSWDSRGLPDGPYRVRLTADDHLENSPGESFARSRVSDPFPVDNTPPRISSLEVGEEGDAFTVAFEASDPEGRIAAVEFTLEDGSWQALDPLDGVADSDSERYRFVVGRGEGEGGKRNLRLRVTDNSGNVGGALRVLEGR